MMRSSVFIFGVVAVGLVGCAGSEGETSDSSVAITSADSVVDLADGAFVRNESESGSTTDETDAQSGEESSSSTPAGDVPTSTSADPAATTTVDTGASTGGESTDGGNDTGSATTTDGTATGGASTSGGATSGGTTAGSATTVPGTAVGEGIVTINDVRYPFTTTTCEFAQDEVFVEGEGTSSAGARFEVAIEFGQFDLDGDGELDLALFVALDPLPSSEDDFTDLPEFYATKIDGAGLDQGEDITVSVGAGTISGSGPIEDLNGVDIPDEETAPMTFEARCS